MLKSLLLILPAMLLHTGPSVVVRHDVEPGRFIDAATRFEASVVQIRYRDADGLVVAEGTVIDERWVLTAAHSVDDVVNPVTVRFRGVEYPVDSVVGHPDWNGVFEDLHDIALLRLAAPIGGASPVRIYRGSGEEGGTLHVVGRGMTGTGRTGPTADDGVLRAATNRVSEAGPLHLAFVFDAPGSEEATELEGISGPGDSGGPAFLVERSAVWLAGVSSAQDSEATGGREGVYGVVEYYTRVSAFQSWIDSVTKAGPLAPLGVLPGRWIAQGSGFATELTYSWLQPGRALGVTNVVTGSDGGVLTRYSGMYAWDGGSEEIVFFTAAGDGEIHRGRAWWDDGVLWHEAEVSGGGVRAYASAIRPVDGALEYFADYGTATATADLLTTAPIQYMRATEQRMDGGR